MKIKLSEYAKQEGIAYRTAVTHYHAGLIPGAYQKSTGAIFVNVEENLKPKENKNIRVALYSRISSNKNENKLNVQQKHLEDYAAAKGYTITHNVTEISSSLNDTRNHLNNLLLQDDWDILLIENKDRLTLFSFKLIEILLHKEHKQIEILDISNKEDKEDLTHDFKEIIKNFSTRLTGKKLNPHQTEDLIKDIFINNRPQNFTKKDNHENLS
jgi:putative resolvase